MKDEMVDSNGGVSTFRMTMEPAFACRAWVFQDPSVTQYAIFGFGVYR